MHHIFIVIVSAPIDYRNIPNDSKPSQLLAR